MTTEEGRKKSRREYTHSMMNDLGPELVEEQHDAKCLRCDSAFIAPSKFHRLCPACRGQAHKLDYMEYAVSVEGT
jgi:Zn finger protein HypA/HybF involved in hydrogenase expression